jgi:hypothetical protein
MRSLGVLLLVVFAAACGGSSGPDTTTAAGADGTFPSDALAIRANADVAVGTERLLVGVARPDATRLGSPDDPVTLEVSPAEDANGGVQRAPGVFTWIVPDVVGLYRAVFDFDHAGTWQVTVAPEEGPPLEPVLFSVLDRSCSAPDAADRGLPQCALQVGDTAPLVASPTGDEFPLDEITTDLEPDPRMYELSLDEALADGRPTVVVFATPAFCQSQACGPLLDNTKTLVDDHPEVDFVHVEVYQGFRQEGFDPTDPEALAPAVTAFGLLSEPWVFVVDASGVITARFEGVMDASELDAALDVS